MDNRNDVPGHSLTDAIAGVVLRFLIVSTILLVVFTCYFIVPKLQVFWMNTGAVPVWGIPLIKTSHFLVNYFWVFVIAAIVWGGSTMLPQRARRPDEHDRT